MKQLESDILEIINYNFFHQMIRGLVETKINIRCPLCYGGRNIEITYNDKLYDIRCPQCDGAGTVEENRLQKYQTHMQYIDFALTSSACDIRQFYTTQPLKTSDDILQIQNSLKQDLYNMWMSKWYHRTIYCIKWEYIIPKCSVCKDNNYIEVIIKGQQFNIRCPECLHKHEIIKWSIVEDKLRACRFTVNRYGIKENLGYWSENCGQVTPYLTYDAAVEAKDKKLRGE